MSRQQVSRARKLAFEILYVTDEEQYALLWDYTGEVTQKNPGTTMIMNLDTLGTGKFDRLYVALAACKDGLRNCRPIIGLDGCHLKGPIKEYMQLG